MESTPLFYQTLVQVLSCHQNWLDFGPCALAASVKANGSAAAAKAPKSSVASVFFILFSLIKRQVRQAVGGSPQRGAELGNCPLD